MLITKLAQALQNLHRHLTNTAFTLDRLNHNGGSFRSHRGAGGFDVDGCNMIKARHFRAKTFEMLRIAGCCNGCQRSAMKRAFKRNNPISLWISFGEMIAPRDLDSAFAGLGA